MITGQEKADTGSFTVGPTVKLGYIDQSRESLDANKTVWEEISGGNDIDLLGKREVSSRAYCAVSTSRDRTSRRRSASSPAASATVHLAKMLKTGANVLLLDEPTNDLDVDTLRALEEALGRLRRLRRDHQPRPLVPRPHRYPHAGLRGRQPGGVVRGQLPGLRGRPAGLGAEADQPHRIKHSRWCGLEPSEIRVAARIAAALELCKVSLEQRPGRPVAALSRV